MPNAIATMTTHAPKSGSRSSSALIATITASKGRKPRSKRLLERLLRVQEVGLAHRVAGRVQHDEQLHEFGRLHVDDHERQPAFAAVDGLADARHQDCDEQQRARNEQIRRQPLPHLDRHLKGDIRRQDSRRHEDRVAREEVPRTIARVGHGFGGRDRCRIHHHQADGQQQQRGPRERRVEGQHRTAFTRCRRQRRQAWKRGAQGHVSRHAPPPSHARQRRP